MFLEYLPIQIDIRHYCLGSPVLLYRILSLLLAYLTIINFFSSLSKRSHTLVSDGILDSSAILFWWMSTNGIWFSITNLKTFSVLINAKYIIISSSVEVLDLYECAAIDDMEGTGNDGFFWTSCLFSNLGLLYSLEGPGGLQLDYLQYSFFYFSCSPTLCYTSWCINKCVVKEVLFSSIP